MGGHGGRGGRLEVLPVGVPVDRHRAPEGDALVVGEALVVVHLVAEVQVGDVGGHHRLPLEVRRALQDHP